MGDAYYSGIDLVTDFMLSGAGIGWHCETDMVGVDPSCTPLMHSADYPYIDTSADRRGDTLPRALRLTRDSR